MSTCGRLFSMTLSNSDVAHLRLLNQGLSKIRFMNSSDAVSQLGEVPAQDYSSGKWAAGHDLRVQLMRSWKKNLRMERFFAFICCAPPGTLSRWPKNLQTANGRFFFII